MSDVVKFIVKSIHGELLNKDINSLRFISHEGDVGIYPNHTRSMINSSEGVFELTLDEEQVLLYYLSAGIVVVKDNIVTALVDYLKMPKDFDIKLLQGQVKDASKSYKEATKYDEKMRYLTQKVKAEKELEVALTQ